MARLDHQATLEEADEFNERKVIKALALALLDEFNRRRQLEADLIGDVIRELNALRALTVLDPLTPTDLTAKAPPQVTVDQLINQVKAKLRE